MTLSLDNPVGGCWSPGDRVRVADPEAWGLPPVRTRPAEIAFACGGRIHSATWGLAHDRLAADRTVLVVAEVARHIVGVEVPGVGGLFCHPYWLEAVGPDPDPAGEPCVCPRWPAWTPCTCGRIQRERAVRCPS